MADLVEKTAQSSERDKVVGHIRVDQDGVIQDKLLSDINPFERD